MDRLLLLGTAAASTLGSLNSLLVALSSATLETGHEASSLLEGTLEVAAGGLAEDVDLGKVGLEGALEGDDGLDEEGVGVLEVEVHDAHHEDAHHLGAEELLGLGEIVGVDGGGDELALLSRAHRRRLDILESGEICGVARLAAVCWILSRRRATATYPSSC